MMGRLQNLESSNADTTMPQEEEEEVEVDHYGEAQHPEAPHPSPEETPPVHANRGVFLTPLQEIEASGWHLTMEDHTMTKLINICDNASCPKHLLDKILSTIQKATVNGHFDAKRPHKRETFIKYLHAKFKDS
jgi:hypothetical protein